MKWYAILFAFTFAHAYDPPPKWHGLDLAKFFGTYNTVTGTLALNSCTSCGANVADGYQVLYSCTTCTFNVVAGYQAGNFCTTCQDNVGVGAGALGWSTVEYDNVAVGAYALGQGSGGGNNVAIGSSAMVQAGSTGSVGIGAIALQWGENYSTAVGYSAMNVSRSATGYNTAVGAYALNGNPNLNLTGNVGSYNVALGAYALYLDSTGNGNTVTGYQAMYSNSTGGFNNASGEVSLYSNVSGGANVAEGLGSLYSNTTGSSNTGIGVEALISNTTGSDNTAIGDMADVGSGSLTNAAAVGYGATVSSSNQVIIGNSSVTSIGGAVNFTKISDGRYKKNIRQNVPGLVFINKLTPITYTLDVAGMESKLHHGGGPSLPGVAAGAVRNADEDPVMKQAMQEKAAVVETGFIAQDVEKAADSVGFVFSGIDKPKNADQSFYGLRYADFVPPLVKAVQELSAARDSADSVINSLQTRVDSLQTQINELRALVMAQKSAMSGASLDQNAPNPFTGSTVIGYNLPPGVISAQLQITDISGRVVAAIPLSGSGGRNAVTADASGLAAGTYQYSLVVNGKLVGTRQMVLVR